MESNSLLHTKWSCKYHIVFTPKFRREKTYRKKAEIGKRLRELCEQKSAEIIEVNTRIDHIHMLVLILTKKNASNFIGFLKGKSSLMIFKKFANLKYRYRNSHFQYRQFYVDIVESNKATIEEYIKIRKKKI